LNNLASYLYLIEDRENTELASLISGESYPESSWSHSEEEGWDLPVSIGVSKQSVLM
jgi:hypothetical protein